MKIYRKPQIALSIHSAAPRQKVELTERQIQQLKSVGQISLIICGIVGVALLTAIAPNIFMALDKIFGKKSNGSRNKTVEKRKYQIINSFYYLKRRSYIKLTPRGNTFSVQLTEKGQAKLARIDFATLGVKRPRSWPKTWWVVIADIPSKQFRRQADLFREKLKTMGFYPLQRTVWFHPFDPRQEIDYIATHYRIGPFITTLEAATLDPSDEDLLTNFFTSRKVI